MPALYEVKVKGHADSRYFAWCETLSVQHTEVGETVLLVSLRDQAELYGLLAQIRDLALPLLSLVEQTSAPPEGVTE